MRYKTQLLLAQIEKQKKPLNAQRLFVFIIRMT